MMVKQFTKAMILAAGAGTRLGQLTNRTPKPMVRIGGRPVLEHNVRLLARHGIRQIMINLHHCPSVITDYFGDGHRWDVSITYSHEPHLLGTAGAVKNVASFLDEPFLLLYGDNLTSCDLKSLCSTHRQKCGIGTLALYYREDPTASGIVGLDPDDRITRFVEKPIASEVFSRWVNAGLMVFEPAVLDYIASDQPSDFGRDVLPRLLEKHQDLFAYRMNEELGWIDTEADYRRLQQRVESGEVQLP